jgi:hypothetical protein
MFPKKGRGVNLKTGEEPSGCYITSASILPADAFSDSWVKLDADSRIVCKT